MPVSRRGFLGALAGLVAAPMIVKIDSIMPVKVMEPVFPEMAFTIEKVMVHAKSRYLKAEYTMELAQDLKAMHGLDVEAELYKMFREEVIREKWRPILDYPTTPVLIKPQRSYIKDLLPGIQLPESASGSYSVLPEFSKALIRT